MEYYGILPSPRKAQFAARCAICFLWKPLSRDQISRTLLDSYKSSQVGTAEERAVPSNHFWWKVWMLLVGYWGLPLSSPKPITLSLFSHLSSKYHPSSLSSWNTLSIMYLIDTYMDTYNFGFPKWYTQNVQNGSLNFDSASFQWAPIIYLSVYGNVEQYQENQWNYAMDDQVGVDEIALKSNSSHWEIAWELFNNFEMKSPLYRVAPVAEMLAQYEIQMSSKHSMRREWIYHTFCI